MTTHDVDIDTLTLAKGDVDSGDPSGVSQGNPWLPVGATIRYAFDGRLIVVPPRTGSSVADRLSNPMAVGVSLGECGSNPYASLSTSTPATTTPSETSPTANA